MKTELSKGSHRYDIEFPGWYLDISYSILGHYSRDRDDAYDFEARIGEVVLHTPAGLSPLPVEALGESYSQILHEISDSYSAELDNRDLEENFGA